ncbi:MAG: hypothetical protein SF052_08235 [Bacteroidia bacterium]|nr:hypothetical protein [Bacteroidia bacterium]
MKIKLVALLLFFAGIAFTAAAQTATPNVTQSQAHQTKRIKHGVKSGELTPAETRALAKQQRRINRGKKVAKADGTVTAGERAALNARQNRASRNIYRKKHN